MQEAVATRHVVVQGGEAEDVAMEVDGLLKLRATFQFPLAT
ncbi:hypothetical protein [Microbispora sp. NBRC 16548]|nr:hypothetical protein [Microbispora sp. NBRC 16548]GLX06461.1 hypothetical protein Misp03_33880 [Microbispora sp. NBRC 16548]